MDILEFLTLYWRTYLLIWRLALLKVLMAIFKKILRKKGGLKNLNIGLFSKAKLSIT